MTSLERNIEEMFLKAWIIRDQAQAGTLHAIREGSKILGLPEGLHCDFSKTDRNSDDFSWKLHAIALTLVEQEVAAKRVRAGRDLEVVAAKAAGWAVAVERPDILSIGTGVAKLIQSIEIQGPPEEPPTLFKQGAIFVRTKCEAPLTHDYRVISMYQALGAWYVTLFRDDLNGSVEGYRCDLNWGAASIDDMVSENKFRRRDPVSGMMIHEAMLPGDRERRLILPAVRWLLAFAMLLDSHGAPLEVSDGSSVERLLRKKRAAVTRKVQYRSVYLSKAGQHTVARVQAEEEASSEASREGLVRRPVQVRPFLRWQSYGPKNSLRRRTYVEGFESTRWAKSETSGLVKTRVRLK